jgi:hypothetical protein
MNDLHRETHAALGLGPASLETNRRILNGMTSYLNEIGTSGNSLQLFDWIRTAYTLVSAATFYGEVNPLSENPVLAKLLW